MMLGAMEMGYPAKANPAPVILPFGSFVPAPVGHVRSLEAGKAKRKLTRRAMPLGGLSGETNGSSECGQPRLDTCNQLMCARVRAVSRRH